MNNRRALLIFAWFLVGMTFLPFEARGQADPDWLRSWNEAQKARPLELAAIGRIAPQSEPGIPLIVRGRLFGPDDTPADGIIVHAYHRDHDGYDFGPNDNSLTTWRLQGWVKTDAEGRFKFVTTRPAPDHLGREGAHIHFTIDSNEFGRQWAPTVFFADDPLVTAIQHLRSNEAGEYGRVRDVQTEDGVQHIDVVFRLKKEPDF